MAFLVTPWEYPDRTCSRARGYICVARACWTFQEQVGREESLSFTALWGRGAGGGKGGVGRRTEKQGAWRSHAGSGGPRGQFQLSRSPDDSYPSSISPERRPSPPAAPRGGLPFTHSSSWPRQVRFAGHSYQSGSARRGRGLEDTGAGFLLPPLSAAACRAL